MHLFWCKFVSPGDHKVWHHWYFGIVESKWRTKLPEVILHATLFYYRRIYLRNNTTVMDKQWRSLTPCDQNELLCLFHICIHKFKTGSSISVLMEFSCMPPPGLSLLMLILRLEACKISGGQWLQVEKTEWPESDFENGGELYHKIVRHTCQVYRGYFRDPRWFAMRPTEISRVTWQLCSGARQVMIIIENAPLYASVIPCPPGMYGLSIGPIFYMFIISTQGLYSLRIHRLVGIGIAIINLRWPSFPNISVRPS